ncbi:histidine kinase [Paenibacillus sp. KS-LC4]|uniref:sensor histidine kinase n=1 Tax=Paenibacillus sp. KS-LC4 TaxID=2979727 RepID=UPI0030D00F2B
MLKGQATNGGLSIFQKLALGLMLMFLSIVVIFWWIYQLNVKDIQTELRNNKLGEVKFMTSQLSNQFEQILMNAIILSEDQTVRGYPYVLERGDDYSKYEMKLAIIEKLALNSASTSWNNTVILYYPDQRETVSSDPSFSFQKFELPDEPLNQWTIHMEADGEGYYSHLTKGHLGPLYIETRISLDNLRKMMQQYTSGTPLLYDAHQMIAIRNEGSSDLAQADSWILPLIQGNSGFITLEENQAEYLLSYMKLDMLELYFIDYHPITQLIKPISRNNTLFVIALVALLLISLIYSLILHNQVRTPIIGLRKAIDRFDRGDYSSRVVSMHTKEFGMLGKSFNRMAEHTQFLIEQVLLGDLSIQEARLKQYQAQINPHFLYNCLNYIQSKASIKDHAAVTAMTLELASYCRYINKIEDIDSTLQEELNFVKHYLSIMHMRKKTINYTIEVDGSLSFIRLPRMILQPLVENCIKHGIEPSMLPGLIEIKAEEDAQDIRIYIRDNGVGISEERLAVIANHMEEFMHHPEDAIGTGIRNVNQRLRLYFGKSSGLALQRPPSGGTCYIITIQKREEKHAANIVS